MHISQIRAEYKLEEYSDYLDMRVLYYESNGLEHADAYWQGHRDTCKKFKVSTNHLDWILEHVELSKHGGNPAW